MLDVDPAPIIKPPNHASTDGFYTDTVDAIISQTSRKKPKLASIEHIASSSGNGTIRPPGHMQTINCQTLRLPCTAAVHHF
jgi:hypothetical protein